MSATTIPSTFGAIRMYHLLKDGDKLSFNKCTKDNIPVIYTGVFKAGRICCDTSRAAFVCPVSWVNQGGYDPANNFNGWTDVRVRQVENVTRGSSTLDDIRTGYCMRNNISLPGGVSGQAVLFPRVPGAVQRPASVAAVGAGAVGAAQIPQANPAPHVVGGTTIFPYDVSAVHHPIAGSARCGAGLSMTPEHNHGGVTPTYPGAVTPTYNGVAGGASLAGTAMGAAGGAAGGAAAGGDAIYHIPIQVYRASLAILASAQRKIGELEGRLTDAYSRLAEQGIIMT